MITHINYTRLSLFLLFISVIISYGFIEKKSNPLPNQTNGLIPIKIKVIGLQPIKGDSIYNLIHQGIISEYANYREIQVDISESSIAFDDSLYSNTKNVVNVKRLNRLVLEEYKGCYDKVICFTELPITIGDFLESKDTTYNGISFMAIRGFTDPEGGVSTISSYKIKHEYLEKDAFSQAIKKVSKHEFGHLLGLKHCANKTCLMSSGRYFLSSSFDICEQCHGFIKTGP